MIISSSSVLRLMSFHVLVNLVSGRYGWSEWADSVGGEEGRWRDRFRDPGMKPTLAILLCRFQYRPEGRGLGADFSPDGVYRDKALQMNRLRQKDKSAEGGMERATGIEPV